MVTNLGAMPSNQPVFGASARAVRTSGDLSLNSTTWADADTGLDLVIAAVTGDWVEVGLSAVIGAAVVTLALDAVSVVAGSPVNNWSKDGAEGAAELGVQGWLGFSGAFSNATGSVIKQMAAGDLSGGNVTIRLRFRTTAAVAKAMNANTNQPLIFWAHNLKQP